MTSVSVVTASGASHAAMRSPPFPQRSLSYLSTLGVSSERCRNALSLNDNKTRLRKAFEAPPIPASPHPSRRSSARHVSASLFGSSVPRSSSPSASPAASSASSPSTADLATAAEGGKTVWFQKTLELPPYKRGCHIITSQIMRAVPEIAEYKVGIANLFVLHTSASLTINENASPDVPLDLEDSLNRIAPEGNHYRHLDEGYDDMPAHVKSSLMGCSLTIPIMSGRFKLGTWQGIYLNEHRNHGGARQLCITIHGEKRADGRVYR